MSDSIKAPVWMKFTTRCLYVTRVSKPPIEQWENAIAGMDQQLDSSPFWRGDLYNKGAQWYGENAASSIFDPMKSNIKTWQNNAAVCERIEPSRRREELSYSHHAEVAYLNPEEFEDPPRESTEKLQDYYLQIAIDNQMSTRELRDKIKEDKGKNTITPLHKRLKDTAGKLEEWLPESDGDVHDLIIAAILALKDAADIQKDIEDG